ncbi:MAG: hypothetical protein WAO52_05935 [Prolixibacteraceae bacterium]
MKTKHNNQKTENRNFRVLILRASAVVFSLVLISLTSISAQELLQQYFKSNVNSKMMADNAGKTNEFEKADAVFEAVYSELSGRTNPEGAMFASETETDHELAIESWMTDETIFGSNFLSITEETDNALIVEDWMILNSNFSANNFAINQEPETILAVESWMLNAGTFNSSNLQTDLDPDSRIEPWMINHDCFKWNNELTTDPMMLEAWMTDDQLWGI